MKSIKSIFRASGIEPDNVLVFREYGGSKNKSIDSSRELKTNTLYFLQSCFPLEHYKALI